MFVLPPTSPYILSKMKNKWKQKHAYVFFFLAEIMHTHSVYTYTYYVSLFNCTVWLWSNGGDKVFIWEESWLNLNKLKLRIILQFHMLHKGDYQSIATTFIFLSSISMKLWWTQMGEKLVITSTRSHYDNIYS